RNLDELEQSTVSVGGSVKTLKRKYDEISADSEKMDRDIDTLLTRGKNDLAASAQAQLNSKQQLAQEYYEQWQQQQAEYQKMLDARLKLEARLTTIKQEREHLQSLMELAKAKESTIKTVKSLNDLAGVGDADIKRLGDAIRERLDRSDAELEMSTNKLQLQVDDALEKNAVDSQLEERKKRLGLSGSIDASAGGAASDAASGSTGN
ncbi:MAG TPA: PspA/IM30 family protein, partial [Aggregatilineales bacterium]|nr:PspA/IM30 family protein [Aggregatilineales bacterium]